MKIYIDEAGRGPLAWPVYVGLVLPLKNFHKKQFKDSKQLSSKQRENLLQKIDSFQAKSSLIYSIGTADNHEIDELWIIKAINLAIQRALFELLKKYYQNFLGNILSKWLCSCDIINKFAIENILRDAFSTENLKNLIQIVWQTNPIHEIIIDGNLDFNIQKDLNITTRPVIKWDQKIPEISIASIIAKVYRDQYMVDSAHTQYPKYNFEKHKWYGTQEHIANIKKYGHSPIHRKSYIVKKPAYQQVGLPTGR